MHTRYTATRTDTQYHNANTYVHTNTCRRASREERFAAMVATLSRKLCEASASALSYHLIHAVREEGREDRKGGKKGGTVGGGRGGGMERGKEAGIGGARKGGKDRASVW